MNNLMQFSKQIDTYFSLFKAVDVISVQLFQFILNLMSMNLKYNKMPKII